MVKLHHIVEKVLIDTFSDKYGVILTNIMLNWNKIVEKDFIYSSNPTRIASRKSQSHTIKTLHINTINPAVAFEMSYCQESIVDNVNLNLGYIAINQIKIHTT